MSAMSFINSILSVITYIITYPFYISGYMFKFSQLMYITFFIVIGKWLLGKIAEFDVSEEEHEHK